MECLKEQLQKLKQEDENTQVFIITFNKSVHLLGDCSTNGETISDLATLNDINACIEKAASFAGHLCSQPLKYSFTNIIQKLNDELLKPETAMGPAICCSIGVAKHFKSSTAQTIIFTDGLSNVGLGLTDAKSVSDGVFLSLKE